MKTAIVYSTTISNNISNAFVAWADFVNVKNTNEARRKKAKKKVADEAEGIKSRALFNTFVMACEKENKNYKNVADTLRKELYK